VHSLPTMQRATTVLFYFEDRPVAEIVDILGISEGSVKVHLHRARLRLAERLDEVVSDDAG
jgi:DNA-directed RNA polymerase specialized sigma24 family protein